MPLSSAIPSPSTPCSAPPIVTLLCTQVTARWVVGANGGHSNSSSSPLLGTLSNLQIDHDIHDLEPLRLTDSIGEDRGMRTAGLQHLGILPGPRAGSEPRGGCSQKIVYSPLMGFEVLDVHTSKFFGFLVSSFHHFFIFSWTLFLLDSSPVPLRAASPAKSWPFLLPSYLSLASIFCAMTSYVPHREISCYVPFYLLDFLLFPCYSGPSFDWGTSLLFFPRLLLLYAHVPPHKWEWNHDKQNPLPIDEFASCLALFIPSFVSESTALTIHLRCLPFPFRPHYKNPPVRTHTRTYNHSGICSWIIFISK